MFQNVFSNTKKTKRKEVPDKVNRKFSPAKVFYAF
jgi:hypothetical protein